MYEGRSVLAVVPARGGSKGVPLKNIHPLGGRPLIAWTGDVVAELDLIDRAVVSTDSPQIAEIARAHGLEAPFLRPEPLSGDRVSDFPVLVHALEHCEGEEGRRYDVVVMLQPTSPLRRPEHVRRAIERLVEGGFDSVWTVSPTDSKAHPLKQLVVRDDLLGFYDERGAQVVARQQLDTLYHRNGVAYAITRACLLEHGDIRGRRSAPLIIEEPMVSIDTLWDFAVVEWLLQKRLEKA
jgi:CMP-N,N'-diacetyllegionaminic acid synthase